MPQTSGRPINGKYVEEVERGGITGSTPSFEGEQLLMQIREQIREIKEPQPKLSEHIEIPNLYKYFSLRTGAYEIEAPIASISQIVGDAINRVRDGIQEEDDQLQRENHVAVAFSTLNKLATFVGFSPTFDEAVSLLFIGIAAHRDAPYSRAELVALEKALEMLRRNPVPTEDELKLLYDVLDVAGFDLNAPLADLELEAYERED